MTPLSVDQWIKAVKDHRGKIPATSYRAMYSTWWDGIVTDPALMMLPLDDHMVHRGDGIFEAARILEGAIFDLPAHLNRLEVSASRIGLKLPMSLGEIAEHCRLTAKAAALKEAAVRVFVGRGPGSFSPNPYESPESQLYIVVTEFKAVSESVYLNGAKAIVSKVPQKNSFFTQIKSCNYLPNVLMKKEAVDNGVMFSLGCSEAGLLYEGPTENLSLIDASGTFLVPKFDYTLRGTTLLALIDALERQPVPGISGVKYSDITIAQLYQAREAFMVGTTLEVLPLVEVDGKAISGGQPGALARELRSRLRHEMLHNKNRRTVI